MRRTDGTERYTRCEKHSENVRAAQFESIGYILENKIASQCVPCFFCADLFAFVKRKGSFMGLTRIQEHTKMAGATYKMGNKVLVNTDIFEAYLEQYRIPGDYEGMAKKFTPDLVELYR